MPRFVVIAKDPLIAAEAVAKRLPEGAPAERHYASDLTADAIFTHLGSPDLFSSHKAYHYVDFLDLKLNKREGERFAGLLSRLPEEITLVCSQVLKANTRGEEERVLRREDYRRVAEGAQVDDLRRMSDDMRAQQWRIDRARERYGLVLTSVQMERLYFAAGEQVALVDMELSKLSTLKSADKPQQISDELLESSISLNPVAKFYDLVDAIVEKQEGVQAQLAAWFALEPATFRLISEMGRRLLALLAMQRGERVQPPFLERKLRRVIARWPTPRLARAIRLLAKLEHELKSGLAAGLSTQDAELTALQMFIADLGTAQAT